MSKILMSRLLVAAAACAVAACGGGGGGGGGGVGSTPPPPPPPPPATVSAAIFPGVTTDTDFAVLGVEGSLGEAASDLTKTGFSVRYDAETKNYLIDLPSSNEFRFDPDSESSSNWYGTANGDYLEVFKPTSTNPNIQLSYTTFGATGTGFYSSDFNFFAFGLPTPNSGVPVTGSASYNALIFGRALDTGAYIDGDATLLFNFGAGTLSGHLDPVLHTLDNVNTDLGTYNFVNTIFGVGSATFSGGLSHSGTSNLGAFDGRFTGPAAQELMGRWNAPYLNPTDQQWNDMFGIMVGKKQ